MGLGRLGGSLAAISYFLERGVAVHITDQKKQEELTDSLEPFLHNEHVTFHFGGHVKEDFIGSDAVICSPAVPYDSQGVLLAREYASVYNDLSFFLETYGEVASPYIGVTGTRGKTTTTQWIAHFLESSLYGGNMPQRGFFWFAQELEKGNKSPLVAEISSFQLEYMNERLVAPYVAVVTNLFVDHINRHKTMDVYAEMKSRLVLYQKESDHAIFNFDDPRKSYFEKLPLKSKRWYVSCSSLPKDRNGLFLNEKDIYFKEGDVIEKVGVLEEDMGRHMKYNLLASLLAAYLYKNSWEGLFEKIATLPDIPLRQERIINTDEYLVVNDGAATNPDAVIAALERFYVPGTAFICGGTDKELDMSPLAKVIGETVSPQDLFLLEGSATTKLYKDLSGYKGYEDHPLYGSLEDIVKDVVGKSFKRIVFSPGGSSFEKFKNEFHRGEVFSQLVRKYMDV